jgi:hypothetical protein
MAGQLFTLPIEEDDEKIFENEGLRGRLRGLTLGSKSFFFSEQQKDEKLIATSDILAMEPSPVIVRFNNNHDPSPVPPYQEKKKKKKPKEGPSFNRRRLHCPEPKNSHPKATFTLNFEVFQPGRSRHYQR